MNVIAYCASDYVEATRRAAGVEPLVCPPVNADNIDPRVLEGRDLIYLNLHALPGIGALLGTRRGRPIALRMQQLNGLNLGGAVVFVTSCYLGSHMHPMRDAFLDAGAGAVIAGDGKNWTTTDDRLAGANLLGLWVRRGLEVGVSIATAMRLAKMRLALRPWSAAARDAIGFQIFERI